MKKIFSFLVFFLVIKISVFANSDIKITEVFFRATGDSVDFVELYNTGDDDVNLNGWKIYYNSSEPVAKVFSNVTLKPGQLLVLWFDQSIIDDELEAPAGQYLNNMTDVSGLSITSDYVVLTDEMDNMVDAVIWSRYQLDGAINDFFTQAITNNIWNGFPKGNSFVTPKVLDGFSLRHSITRFYQGDTLYSNPDYSYKNWIEYPQTRPGRKPPKRIKDFSDKKIEIELKDTPNDLGGNITVTLLNHAGEDFYRYNLYITDNPVHLTNSELRPELMSFNRFTNQMTVTTMNGELLENNRPYYILVTYTNKYGYENRDFRFTQSEYPIQQLTATGRLIFTQLVVSGGDGLENMIEIYCLDDGNNGQGMNLAGYSVGTHRNVRNILSSAPDQYRGDIKTFGNSIIRTGERIILTFNTNENDDRRAAGNVLKTYTHVAGLLATREIVVLYNPFGDALDAVGYVRTDLTATLQAVLDVLYDYEMWHSNHHSSLLDSFQMTSNYAAVRRTDANGNYIVSSPGHASDWNVGQPISVGSPVSAQQSMIGDFNLNNRTVNLSGNESQRNLNIELEILMPTTLTIRVYDIQSRMIREIIREEEYMLPSTYNFVWDAKDYKNSTVPAGIYILLIDAYNNNYGYRRKITETIVVGKSF